MELRILQYFLMVAREKNITRAAKQLTYDTTYIIKTINAVGR